MRGNRDNMRAFLTICNCQKRRWRFKITLNRRKYVWQGKRVKLLVPTAIRNLKYKFV